MAEDDKTETPLKLVVDNPSATIEQRRTEGELGYAESRATDAIRRLAINLLRIIAGAGEPLALLRDIDTARTAYRDYIGAAERAGRSPKFLTSELDLDRLFSHEERDRQPTTEEDWHRWAEPVDPHEEYYETKIRAKLELRRAALRQVASVLSSRESREPSLRAHGGNLDEIIQSILSAKPRLQQRRLRPPESPDPSRQAIAKQKIAELRRERRMHQLKSLPAHQVAGLRAVEARMVDQTDSFTLDVLGSMKLLTRPKGNKGKSAWQLTEDGKLALNIHSQRER